MTGTDPEPVYPQRAPDAGQAGGERGNEYEPNDSRNVTGTAHTPDGRWSGGDAADQAEGGEYEPGDSRIVTGAAQSEDGRWTKDAASSLAPVEEISHG